MLDEPAFSNDTRDVVTSRNAGGGENKWWRRPGQATPALPAREVFSALPLTAFVGGLILAPFVVNPWGLVSGMVGATALLIFGRWVRPALILCCLLIGLVRGMSEIATANRGTAAVKDAEQRFVTLEANIGHGWEPTEMGGYSLTSSTFTIIEPTRLTLRRPLTIYVTGRPARTGFAKSVVAEGFLKVLDHDRYSLSVKSVRLVSYRGSLRSWDPSRWNRAVDLRLDELVEHAPGRARTVALVRAVALGRSQSLPDEVRESYRRGGIYHLLVFSGMQIAIAAAFLLWIFRRLRTPRIGDWILLALSFVAPSFAGDEPSVSRASWMIGLYAFSRLLRRPTSFENLLFVSAFLRLIVYPTELTDGGFALTYAATGGLIFIGKPLSRAVSQKKWLSALAYSAGAELATSSLIMYFFHQYVLGGSVLTLLAAPVVTAMLAISVAVCLGVLISFSTVPFLLDLINFLDRICAALTSIADAMHLSGPAPAPQSDILVAASLFSLLVIALVRSPARLALLCALCLAPAVQARLAARSAGKLDHVQIELLDVGQGDAILLRTRGGAVLVDGGGHAGAPHFGRSTLIPLLIDRGVKHLDAVALSHPHPDHCGGLIGLFGNLPIGELWMSRRHAGDPCARHLFTLAAEHGTTVLFLDRVRGLSRAGFYVEPTITRLRLKRSPLNNSSLVLRIGSGKRSILLTGDIERDGERMLADEEPARIRADILKVPHHGSKSSSSDQFLRAVEARVAILSCGRRNRFGHPDPAVLETLRSASVRLYRTDQRGTVTLDIRDNHLFVTTEFDRSP